MLKQKRTKTGQYNGRYTLFEVTFFPVMLGVLVAGLVISAKWHGKEEVAQMVIPPVQAAVIEPQEAQDVCSLEDVVCEGENKTIEKQLTELAAKRNFPYTSFLIRLAKCESRFNPKAIGDMDIIIKGQPVYSRGLFQISKFYHPNITDEQAFDVTWSANWVMTMIEKGYQHRWSCDKIVKGNLNY